MKFECCECGDSAQFNDIKLPGDKRCAECHLVYLQGEAETWIEEIHNHVGMTGLEFDFMELLP